MTADDLRALSAAATPGPWVRDGYEVVDVAIGIVPEDAELVVWLRNRADAIADLIDATAEYRRVMSGWSDWTPADRGKVHQQTAARLHLYGALVALGADR